MKHKLLCDGCYTLAFNTFFIFKQSNSVKTEQCVDGNGHTSISQCNLGAWVRVTLTSSASHDVSSLSSFEVLQ